MPFLSISAFCADALLHWLLCKTVLLYLSPHPLVNTAKGHSAWKYKLYWCGHFCKVCQTDLHLITNAWLTPFHSTSCLGLQFLKQISSQVGRRWRKERMLWGMYTYRWRCTIQIHFCSFCSLTLLIAQFLVYFHLIVVKIHYKIT